MLQERRLRTVMLGIPRAEHGHDHATVIRRDHDRSLELEARDTVLSQAYRLFVQVSDVTGDI